MTQGCTAGGGARRFLKEVETLYSGGGSIAVQLQQLIDPVTSD
jgi:hypothetical protein